MLRGASGLRGLRLVLILVLVAVAGLASGVYLDRQVLARFVPLENIPSDSNESFQLMAEAWNAIRQSYVGRSGLKKKDLTYGAISGMMEALGDTGHSAFLPPEMVNAQHDFTQGQLKGIGAQVQMKGGHVVIVTPIDGSPAQRAGLHPGDIILKVDGEDIARLPLEQVVSRILGAVGTPVTLSVLTPSSGRTQDVTLIREAITIRNVTWQQLPGTRFAHVRIAAFSGDVTEKLRESLKEIEALGLEGIVLDLRNNPGGLLDQAIGVASLFMDKGIVLQQKDADGTVTPIPLEGKPAALSIPMVVLVNEGSASASEIVAGALQDGGRARLVGETTFGTGTVLKEFTLSDGSALMLAVEEWLTPGGNTIWHKGITPDVEVILGPEEALLAPEAERDMTLEELQSSSDRQLLRALELLDIPSKPKPLLVRCSERP